MARTGQKAARDPDAFPTAQLFLLGEYLLSNKYPFKHVLTKHRSHRPAC